MTVGPPIEHLTRRLLACPAVFLDTEAKPDLRAVLADLLRDIAGQPLLRVGTDALVTPPRTHAKPENRLRLLAVTAWLLHDPAFRDAALLDAATRLLTDGLDPFAEVVDAEACVTDPDRREELARVVLDALGLLPDGETPEQATDRLATLDSAERLRVVRDTQIAEERARRIQEALRQKAAEEAAAKVMRE